MVRPFCVYVRGQRLRDHPVEPGALELLEPLLGQLRVVGGAGQVARAAQVGEPLLHHRPTLRERAVDVRRVVEREQVEGHEAGRRLLGEHVDPRLRGMDPLLQRLELQPLADGDEDLAVEHAPLGQLLQGRVHELGEVAGQRLGVATGELHLVAVAEHDRAEAVPLRLEAQATELLRIGHALHGLGEHRLDGWHHGQVHEAEASAAIAAAPSRSPRVARAGPPRGLVSLARRR